jgi:hypothetical protein
MTFHPLEFPREEILEKEIEMATAMDSTEALLAPDGAESP